MKTENYLQLSDGINLCYAEYGNQEGEPVFLFHGNPGSRISWGLYPGAPYLPGIRIVAPDRPGYAQTDFKKNAIQYWPDDIVELADHLKIEKFHLFGPSGGGPYALACAWKIPDRLKSVGIFGSVGPYCKESVDGINKPLKVLWRIANPLFPVVRIQNRLIAWKARKDPQGLIDAITEVELSDADKRIVSKKEIRSIFPRVFPESYLQHGIGSAYDYTLPKKWPILLDQILIKVICWQAEQDLMTGNMTGFIAEKLPESELILIPHAGHLWIMEHIREVLERLLTLEET